MVSTERHIRLVILVGWSWIIIYEIDVKVYNYERFILYASVEHKNVKAFVSHCGLLGTLEAIHTVTPIIGIPFIFDQFQNIKILVDRGVAIHIDYETMNRNILLDSINRIINNTEYVSNIRVQFY